MQDTSSAVKQYSSSPRRNNDDDPVAFLIPGTQLAVVRRTRKNDMSVVRINMAKEGSRHYSEYHDLQERMFNLLKDCGCAGTWKFTGFQI